MLTILVAVQLVCYSPPKGCMKHTLLRPSANLAGHLAASLQLHHLSRGSPCCTGSHQCLNR